MLRFLTHRGAYALLTFFVVVSAVFFMLRAAPGGPFDGERRLPPEIEANLLAAYDLDAPLYVQYLNFWSKLLKGDLGPSFTAKDFSVKALVARGLPVSAGLGLAALVIALVVGMSIGICAGLHPGSRLDTSLMAISNLNIAIPVIVTAPLLALVFAVVLSWFPAGGSGSLQHYVLPSLALALPYAAAIARLMRGGVAEAAIEPHVKTARAKGLGSARIVTRHILPIASVPLISFLGPAAAGLLTGSVVVEQVFDLPGIGRYFVQGALNRDYTLVMGVVIIYAGAILLFNLLVALVYGLVDPRIRLTR